MIDWYTDDELGIFFSVYPDCNIRFPEPHNTKEEKRDIEKYPFINNKSIKVIIVDYVDGETYSFEIPENYKWDGASIPRLFWRIIGAKTDPRFLIPSMVHDALCENHDYVNCNRYLADRVFERLLYVSGISNFKRWLMFHSTDNFQKFCGWRRK